VEIVRRAYAAFSEGNLGRCLRRSIGTWSEAEGEGFEPSRDLAAPNGFRDDCRSASPWLYVGEEQLSRIAARHYLRQRPITIGSAEYLAARDRLPARNLCGKLPKIHMLLMVAG
jgi:hypothetical protein